MDVDLAFIVGGATTEKIAVANSGFECRGGPKIKRLGRLHVVMAVKKDGGLAGRFQGFRVDQRMEICGDDLDVFEARRAEVADNPVGAALDIGFVFALGANARDAQKLAQVSQMLLAGTVNKVSKIHEALWYRESIPLLI